MKKRIYMILLGILVGNIVLQGISIQAVGNDFEIEENPYPFPMEMYDVVPSVAPPIYGLFAILPPIKPPIEPKMIPKNNPVTMNPIMI